MRFYGKIAREFPDFDQSTLPFIPSTWVDSSWQNDASPSFTMTAYGKTFIVFIDYTDLSLREFEGGKRFHVLEQDDEGETEMVLESDDFREVEDFCYQVPRFDGTHVCKTQTPSLIDIQYLATVAIARGFALGGYGRTGCTGFGTSGVEVGYIQLVREGGHLYDRPDYVFNDDTGCTWSERYSPHAGMARVDSHGVSRLLAHPRMADIAERFA